MAKSPRPGRVKTRLVPALGEEGAAELYSAFLRDAFALAEHVSHLRDTVEPILWFTPRDDRGAFRDTVPAGVRSVAQRGDGLGERLVECFRDARALGFESVVVIGADSPTLPPEFVLNAFGALAASSDLAVGPTEDGGYYLIGAKNLHERVFVGVEWSTNRVFAQTTERAAAARLALHELPRWYDVDEPADLGKLYADPALSTYTRAVLASRARLDD